MEILHHPRPAVDDPEETHVGRFNIFNVAEPVVSWASVQTMEGRRPYALPRVMGNDDYPRPNEWPASQRRISRNAATCA